MPVDGCKSIRLEVSTASSFPSRTSYVQTAIDTHSFRDAKSAEEIRLGTTSLVDGNTYYVRTRAQYATPNGSLNTEFSPVTTFVYSATENAVDDIITDSPSTTAPAVYDMQGRKVKNPAPGLYIEQHGDTSTKILVK